MSDIVPFGKHKGKPVDALLDDREYVDWLTQQGWFREKYGNIYQIVINNGTEPSETPEHNAMQVRFLDEGYTRRFLDRLYSGSSTASKPFQVEFEKEGMDVWITLDDRFERWVCVEIKPTIGDDYPAALRQMDRYAKALRRRPAFSYSVDYALLVGTYTGIGASQEQFIQVFGNNNIEVIFANEID